MFLRALAAFLWRGPIVVFEKRGYRPNQKLKRKRENVLWHFRSAAIANL